MELTQLGNKVALPNNPEAAHLECVPAPSCAKPLSVRFSAPEFTSLCPVTGQPDFAHITIDYVPQKLLVESKSLKLFLGAFRNHASFHERVGGYIFDRLMEALDPQWLRVACFFYPRGGIPIDVFVQSDAQPRGVYVARLQVPEFRGR